MSNEDKWELSVVENAGEMDSKLFTDDIAVSTKQLLIDIKAQLMFMPKHFNYTIGWRTVVWKEKETGRFKDLTEEEYRAFLEHGTAELNGRSAGVSTQDGLTSRDEGVSS
jgi:hypothetical protein